MVAIAIGLLWALVPGATPKNPFSGLIALSCPESSGLSQAMSSPTTVTSNPASLGLIMARLVFPHAEGKAAVMYFLSPWVRICLCQNNLTL